MIIYKFVYFERMVTPLPLPPLLWGWREFSYWQYTSSFILNGWWHHFCCHHCYEGEENLAIDNIQVRLFWTDGDTTSAATTAVRALSPTAAESWKRKATKNENTEELSLGTSVWSLLCSVLISPRWMSHTLTHAHTHSHTHSHNTHTNPHTRVYADIHCAKHGQWDLWHMITL